MKSIVRQGFGEHVFEVLENTELGCLWLGAKPLNDTVCQIRRGLYLDIRLSRVSRLAS